MDTRLQSNEIRIPKPEFDLKSSIGDSCHYFKSSFARSLSFAGNNQTKSLDLGMNSYSCNRFASIDEAAVTNGGANHHHHHHNDYSGQCDDDGERSPLSMPSSMMINLSNTHPRHNNGFNGAVDEDLNPHLHQQSSLSSSTATLATVTENVWTGNGNAQVCLPYHL